MTPLLILIFGIQPVTAIGTDIFYAAVTKTVGGYKHLKLGTVHKGLAFWLAVGSVPSAIAGVWVIELLQRRYGDDLDTLVLGMLGGTLLVVGVATLLRSLFLAGVIQERSAMHLYRRHIIAAVDHRRHHRLRDRPHLGRQRHADRDRADRGLPADAAAGRRHRRLPRRRPALGRRASPTGSAATSTSCLAGDILVGSIPGVHRRHQPLGQGAAEVPPLRARGRPDRLRHDPDREELRPRDRAARRSASPASWSGCCSAPRRSRAPRPRAAARPGRRRRLSRSRLPRRSLDSPGHVRLRQRGHRPRRLRAGRRRGRRRACRRTIPTIEQIVFASVGSIFRNYNLILDQVKDRDDVEALVLIHQDAEIHGPAVPREGPGGARRPRRRRSSAAPGPSTCAASPGGRARSPGPRSPTATTSSAAARSRPSPG